MTLTWIWSSYIFEDPKQSAPQGNAFEINLEGDI
jgi:hypothetical protein